MNFTQLWHGKCLYTVHYLINWSNAMKLNRLITKLETFIHALRLVDTPHFKRGIQIRKLAKQA